MTSAVTREDIEQAIRRADLCVSVEWPGEFARQLLVLALKSFDSDVERGPTEGEATSTSGVLTRGQVARLLDDFKAFHECEEACNHDLNILSIHDAALRQTISQQAQEIERLTRDNRLLNEHITCCRAENDEKIQQLAAMTGEKEEAEQALVRKGYRKQCDIPACNCGPQWNHGGHAESRLREIDDALPWASGKTILNRVDDVVAENAQLQAALAAREEQIKKLEGSLEEWKRRKDLWERDARGYASPEEECDKQRAQQALKGV